MKKSIQTTLHVSVAKQRLALKRGRRTERSYSISTSKFGVGNEEGSMKTPLGRFRIAEKIGAGLPAETAFKSREPMRPSVAELNSDDLIMSRILWLDGLETQNANSYTRFIYIHGTNHEELIGEAASHGCVRMRNADVAELFDLVEVGTEVIIAAEKRVRAPRRKAEKSVAPRVGRD